MSASVLREAAAKMRERAKAAVSGPWMVDPDEAAIVLKPDTPGNGWDGYSIAMTFSDESDRFVNTPHIASWHPAVALAVADWLDAAVARNEFGWELGETPELDPAALSVARAYLGTT